MGLLFLRFIAIVTTPGARWETADWSFDLIQEIADAERDAELRRLEAEKERVKLTAEAEAEKLRLALQSQVDEARALAEHPELVRLKQLETLKELARSGEVRLERRQRPAPRRLRRRGATARQLQVNPSARQQ